MPSDYALVTLPELKTFPGLSAAPETDDAILEALIDSVTTDFEENIWGNYGVQRTVTERVPYRQILRDTRNADILQLSKYPIASVTSITDPAGNTVAATDYWIDYDTGCLRMTGAWPVPYDSNGFESYWTVVYTAGQVASTALVPDDIKLACKMWVAELFKSPTQNVKSKKVGDLELTYRDSKNDGIPDAIVRMVSRWKNRSL